MKCFSPQAITSNGNGDCWNMLFPRFGDIVVLAIEHFILKQFVVVSAGNIMGMCMKVFGKADKGCGTLTWDWQQVSRIWSSQPTFGVYTCCQE